MPRTNAAWGLILGLAAVTIFGGSLPATRIAVVALDPWFVTAARAAIGGIVALAPLALYRPHFPSAQLGTLALIALLLVVAFPAALAIASVSVPSAHGGVVLALLPLATAIAAVLFAGERPSLWFWCLSLAGAGLVAAFALREGDVAIVTGDILLLAGIMITGIGYTLAAILSRTTPGWQVIAWALVLTLPPAVIACVLLWPADAEAVPFSAWAGVIYGGVMTQFVGYAIWNAALALGGVARVAQLQLLQPFVTFVLAAVFLAERIDAAMVAFAAAVGVVVALGRRAAIGQRMAAAAPPAPEG